MTLHITYHDGSNPFVMLNTTKEKIIKEYNYQNIIQKGMEQVVE